MPNDLFIGSMLAFVPNDPRSMLALLSNNLFRGSMLAYVPNDPVYYQVYAGSNCPMTLICRVQAGLCAQRPNLLSSLSWHLCPMTFAGTATGFYANNIICLRLFVNL